jgi:2-polyprenyl-6-methoxyphenol hydroxylase-like FAD-dependent oxidoreductase
LGKVADDPDSGLFGGGSSPRIAIVGAGLAGSLAALLLRRAGFQVTLIEQQSFPRDKVCGECLSALGFAALERAGLAAALLQIHTVQLRRVAIHAGGRSVDLPLTHPMWGIPRWTLDELLLNAARDAGANLLQPARCERIEPGLPPRLRLRDLRTNRCSILSPTIALLADGKGALLPSRPTPTADFGLKAHFTNVDAPRDAIELFGIRGSYGGVAPVGPDRWNAAFSIPTLRLHRAQGDLDRLFANLTHENLPLHRRFLSAQRTTHWQTSPLPRFRPSADWPPGILPIGNAAAALEPIGGEGMGLALRSAELTAAALHSGDFNGASLRPAYRRLWSLRSLTCRAAARWLTSPSWAGPALDWLAADESLQRILQHWLGTSAAE